MGQEPFYGACARKHKAGASCFGALRLRTGVDACVVPPSWPDRSENSPSWTSVYLPGERRSPVLVVDFVRQIQVEERISLPVDARTPHRIARGWLFLRRRFPLKTWPGTGHEPVNLRSRFHRVTRAHEDNADVNAARNILALETGVTVHGGWS